MRRYNNIQNYMKPVWYHFLRIATTVLFFSSNLSWGAAAKDPFADVIRSTNPLDPEDERKSFHLPPGFEVQLFAAEPDIGKPMNMAFDARGRLWITQSREYPFPAPKDRKGRDVIKILEDTDGDGRADKITTFAEGLNIPIGLYPYRNGVIAFSIPNISYHEDTDGDGSADKQQVLYGPFGFEKDTHGMTSAFRRGFDGWIYACHGFNNTTTIKGTDGAAITMNSGNTYRMKIDGSHVEYFTHGQVNPFGLMFDPLGNLYSADCHSSPVYQLMKGGYYPSFGKPDDGLGFAPIMMTHTHGSTAIGGIVFYAGQNFPPEFQSNVFVGNVMTCRINRDRLEDHGSTRLAKEQPDFLSSDDPWFRPVDLQLGPDGAMYVADFYNRIIGHYEVPLTHPGRDRERGRIWRIVYRGEDRNKTVPTRRYDFARAGAEELISALADPNFTYRMLAMNELVDRIGSACVPRLQRAIEKSENSFQKVHSLWALCQLGSQEPTMVSRLSKDRDPMVRTHAMRALSEKPKWAAADRSVATAGLKDSNAFVQRSAAEALGQHPAYENIKPLLTLRSGIPKDDTHLFYMARMALRNQLVPSEIMQRVANGKWNDAEESALSDVAVAVGSPPAAAFLMAHLQKRPEGRDTSTRYLRQIVRYIPEEQLDHLTQFVAQKFSSDIDMQMDLFKSLQEGAAQRGINVTAATKSWGIQLARQLLSTSSDQLSWVNTPLEGSANSANPWAVQSRISKDGTKANFLSSLPNGEQLTGVLRSREFEIPTRLTFYLAGHDGFPDKPVQKRNLVRLCLLADHRVIQQTFPPRNDVAQKVVWDLSMNAGAKGYLELVDGDNGGAYAWLAVGRFDPAVAAVPAANPSQISQRQQAGAEIARTLKARDLDSELFALFTARNAEGEARAAAARALASVAPHAALGMLTNHLNDASEPMALREKLAQAVGEINASDSAPALLESLRIAPHRLAVKITQALASTPEGVDYLLTAVDRHQAPARLLQEKSVKERLTASKAKDVEARLRKLTASLPAIDAERDKLIDQRRSSYKSSLANVALGAKVFEQNCGVCHQIEGKGGLIAPQLDGVASRGVERIIEDILDPNRNVDDAFRYSTITLNDDQVITGLQRREEGEVIVFADSTGKEISIPKKQIKERLQSQSSLMPDNFGEVIAPEDFNNLLGFLISKGARTTSQK
jgi:putative heme-binding domain-containing protein